MKHLEITITQTDLRDEHDPTMKKRIFYTMEKLQRAIEMYQALEDARVVIKIDCHVGIERDEPIRP